MREHEGQSGILIVKGDAMSFEQNAQVAREAIRPAGKYG
tara:strand:+ start:86 stop:202 length:117 start_codon:yes stop_codon:yes gene_type:complete